MPTFEVVDEPEVARLVRFSTGQLNPEIKDQLDFKTFSGNSTSNKRKLMVTTEFNSIEYSAQNFGKSNTFSSDDCDYYVAVQRKGADKIQILPAELFHLNPKLEEKNGPSLSDDEEKVGNDEQTAYRKRMEEKNKLTAEFGSGQSQKIMRRALDRRMDDNMLNLMSQAVPTPDNVSTNASTPGGAASTVESSVVPRHYKYAQRPEDVYARETIIPEDVMEPLTEQSAIFINCTQGDIEKWRNENTYPTIILRMLESLPLSSDKRLSKCVDIMYLSCMIFTYNIPTPRLGRSHFPGEWKSQVKKVLDDRFTICTLTSNNRQKRLRPTHLKDLLLSHILILYMRICDYSIPLTPLIEALKLKSSRLALHSTTLGFKVTGTIDKVATLKVPFSLPPPKRGRAKKRE